MPHRHYHARQLRRDERGGVALSYGHQHASDRRTAPQTTQPNKGVESIATPLSVFGSFISFLLGVAKTHPGCWIYDAQVGNPANISIASRDRIKKDRCLSLRSVLLQ